MGKVNICIYCYLIADILTNVLQACSLLSPLPNRSVLVSSICLVNQKAKFSRKKKQNHLLRSGKGDKAETLTKSRADRDWHALGIAEVTRVSVDSQNDNVKTGERLNAEILPGNSIRVKYVSDITNPSTEVSINFNSIHVLFYPI